MSLSYINDSLKQESENYFGSGNARIPISEIII